MKKILIVLLTLLPLTSFAYSSAVEVTDTSHTPNEVWMELTDTLPPLGSSYADYYQLECPANTQFGGFRLQDMSVSSANKYSFIGTIFKGIQSATKEVGLIYDFSDGNITNTSTMAQNTTGVAMGGGSYIIKINHYRYGNSVNPTTPQQYKLRVACVKFYVDANTPRNIPTEILQPNVPADLTKGHFFQIQDQ